MRGNWEGQVCMLFQAAYSYIVGLFCVLWGIVLNIILLGQSPHSTDPVYAKVYWIVNIFLVLVSCVQFFWGFQSVMQGTEFRGEVNEARKLGPRPATPNLPKT